jgi:long-chain acyl-CoA synthetase
VTSFGRRLAANRPDAIALSDGRVRLRWAEVDDYLNRIANGLRQADLGRERRVGIMAPNAAETALAHLGVVISGASAVPISPHLTAAETAQILIDADIRFVLAGPETAAIAVAAARQLSAATVVAWRNGQPGATSFEDWVAAATPSEPPDGVAAVPPIVYTSGTTGRPKGALLPPVSFSRGTVADHLDQVRRHPMAQYSTHLVVGPMHHAGPMAGIRLLAAGVAVRILRHFDATELLETIASERIETTVMVPTHFQRLLALPDQIRDAADVSSLRYVLHTGAACPVSVKLAMLRWWGPVLYEVYGATEVGPTCGIGPHAWLKHPGSVGRPLPPFDVIVRDESGHTLPTGTEGELWFRDSSGRGLRYTGWAARSPRAESDGLFTLGEIGYVDDSGYVFVTDRAADMVVSGGVNIYPAEAEQVLAAHPRVLDVACIGVPDVDMGERLVALVVPRPDTRVDVIELRDWCRQRLAHYKCPREVELVPELPRTEMGKLNKREARTAYVSRSRASATPPPG